SSPPWRNMPAPQRPPAQFRPSATSTLRRTGRLVPEHAPNAAQFLRAQTAIIDQGRHQRFRRATADLVEHLDDLLADRCLAGLSRRVTEGPALFAVLQPALVLHPLQQGPH